jgi:hypothetical protein
MLFIQPSWQSYLEVVRLGSVWGEAGRAADGAQKW